MDAAASHCLECVKLLIEAGARVNDTDSEGENASDKSCGDVRTYLREISHGD
jgi:ankyrin repeat protein